MQCLPSRLEVRIEVKPQLVLSVSSFEHTVSFVSTTRLVCFLLRGSVAEAEQEQKAQNSLFVETTDT